MCEINKVQNPVLYFAPMCHLSGYCIRQLVRLYHPGMFFMTQMYSCLGILNSNITQVIIDNVYIQELSDTFVQLYASKNKDFISGIRKLKEQMVNLKYVNLNLGCPAGCAKKEKYGYYYQDDQYQLIKMLRESFPDLFISLKIRLKEDLSTYITVCKENQIDQLVVHCRWGDLENKRAQSIDCDYNELYNALQQTHILSNNRQLGYMTRSDENDIQQQVDSDSSQYKLQVVINGGLQSIQHCQHVDKQCFNNNMNSFMIGVGFLHNPRLGLLWEQDKNSENGWGQVYISKESIGKELSNYIYICFLDINEVLMLKQFVNIVEQVDSQENDKQKTLRTIYDIFIQNTKYLQFHNRHQNTIIEKLDAKCYEIQKLQQTDLLNPTIIQQSNLLCCIQKYSKNGDAISLIYYMLINLFEHKEQTKELQRYTQFLGNKIQQERVTHDNIEHILYNILKTTLKNYLLYNICMVVDKSPLS